MSSKKSYYLSLALIFILIFSLELSIPLLGDDALFVKYPLSVKWLVTRYNSWSSRVIIESTLILLSKNIWLFKLLNAGIFILLIDTLSSITIGRNTISLILILLLSLFLPVTLFLSAGLAATSLNYLWPTTFAVFALSNLNKKSYSWKWKLLLVVLILFATNQEQVCIGLLMFFIYRITKNIYTDRKVDKFLVCLFLINLANAINVAICPGNKVRTSKTILTIFPGFAKYSIWDKLNLGISNSGKLLFYRQNFLIITFLLLLVIASLTHTNKRIISAIPGIIASIMVIPFNVFLSTLTVNGYNLATFNKYLLREQKGTMLNKLTILLINLMSHKVSVIWNVLFIIIILLISLAIYFTLRNKSLVIYFILGLGTDIMMGFSPSIFKSGDRTTFILYTVTVYLMLLMIKQIFQSKRKNII